MIVFIPRTDPESNPGQEPDWEWLPRVCPACSGAIVGHGRRSKQAHGARTQTIRYRRGACGNCSVTITVLPAWSLPYTQYRVEVRQQSCRHYAGETPLESSAPALQDGNRSPDAATLRRWFQRRLQSLYCWLRWAQQCHFDFQPPTILAWDWTAALRILIPEPGPG
jgi:hypothetical protein